MTIPLRRAARALLRGCALGIVAVALAACGDATDPTPTPRSPSATATAPAAPPATPRSSGQAETPAPGELTVGQIADGIAAAWGGVTSYRATTVTKGGPTASPVAASPVAASPVAGNRVDVDAVLRPDRRRFTRTVDGTVEAEIVVVGGDVFARGTQPPGIPALPDPGVWRRVYPTAGKPTGDLAVYAGFSIPPSPPYGGLSENERGRIARPVGAVGASGRTCSGYRIADMTQTGERIDVVIAIDAAGLPCSIETRAGGTVTTTTYEFGVELVIEAPETDGE